VDKDFAIARGLHQGYPKKFGSIHQTRPHPFGLAAPRIEAGGRVAGTLAASDRRLAQAVVTLTGESDTNGFVNGHPMAHHRWLPSIENGADPALDELVESGGASFAGGPAWRGTVDVLDLFESPTEELHLLAPREIIGGYYRQVGVSWDGGRKLAAGTSAAPGGAS
jgi:acetoacetate decarboxylase